MPDEPFVNALGRWNEMIMNKSSAVVRSCATVHGLSGPQIGVLGYLHHNEPCNMSTVKESFGVTSSAISQLLDRLVQHGMVSRTEDPEDRRAKRIELTEEGRFVFQKIVDSRHAWMEALADAMSGQERKAATATLEMLTERARGVEGGAVP